MLFQILLMSFPEPLSECSASLAEGLQNIGARASEREHTQPSLGSPAVWNDAPQQMGSDAVASLVPLLEPVYKRPQGEMLQALCDSLVLLIGPPTSQGRISEIFSELLTRKGVSVRHYLALLR
jgi:hypothetical protein